MSGKVFVFNLALAAMLSAAGGDLSALKSKLLAEPPLTARTEVSLKHNPGIVLNGKRYPAFFYNCPYAWPYENAKFRREIQNFAQGDLHLYTLGIESKNAWKGPGKIDLEGMENRIYRALELDGEGYFLFVINATQAPKWWIDANPDELIDYANGGIKPKIDDHSPLDRCPHPSMASLKWRKDFTDYISAIVKHLEASPAGRRIFGYRIDDGVYREWHYMGMDTGMPDTGKAMTAAFRKYLAKKYGSDAALREAWGDKTVTIATAMAATKPERLMTIANGGHVRDPKESAKTIDFLHCQQKETADQLLACDHAVKVASEGRKLCGNYYGYMFDLNYPVEAWHLELKRILESPDVDFNSSPCTYKQRRIDESEFARSLVTSYTLHGKLAILENDTRTVLTPGDDDQKFIYVDDLAQSAGALLRGFCQALTRNAGNWYLDWGQNWYDAPELMGLFRRYRKILDLAAKGNGSVAEVAFVGDLESVYYHRVRSSWAESYLDETVFAMTHAGAPFDTLLFDDLRHKSVRDYRVYVFMNKLYLTAADREVVEKLRRAGKTLVWLYAPGYLDERGHGTDRIAALTGFRVRENPKAANTVMYTPQGKRYQGYFRLREAKVSPSFTLEPTKDVRPLAYRTYHPEADQLIAASRRNAFGGDEYYSASGFMPADFLRRIVRKAGAHVYEEKGQGVVWASESFVAINGNPGKYTLKLPRSKRVTEMLPEEKPISEKTDKIELELTDKVYTRLYHLE